jgi:hypothetical protein
MQKCKRAREKKTRDIRFKVVQFKTYIHTLKPYRLHIDLLNEYIIHKSRGGHGSGRGGAGIGLFPTCPAPSGFRFFQPTTRAKITISAHVWGLRSEADQCGLGGLGSSLHSRLFCTLNKQTQVEVTQPNKQHQTIQTYKQ